MEHAQIRTALAAGAIAIVAVAGGAAMAETATDQAPAAVQCRKAEVNPVTGHALCLDPIGAPVAPPPPEAELPCKTKTGSGEAWTWGPKCKG
jgi:hypothetical protein